MARSLINRRMKFPKHYKSQEGKYSYIKSEVKPVCLFDRQRAVSEIAMENQWLNNTTDYPLLAYPFEFMEPASIEGMKMIFSTQNWAIRQGIVFRNLCFINQIDGGDEWLTIKQFEDGTQLAFESIIFCEIANDDDAVGINFEALIESLLKADYEQCKTPNY
jgi:hypothetical protein